MKVARCVRVLPQLDYASSDSAPSGERCTVSMNGPRAIPVFKRSPLVLSFLSLTSRNRRDLANGRRCSKKNRILSLASDRIEQM